MNRYLLILPTVVMLALVLSSSVAAQARLRWVAPQAGAWKVLGNDAAKTQWSATLILTRRDPAGARVRYRGYFRWLSADGITSGREFVRGLFDGATGRFSLQGYAVKNQRGELGLTGYSARVSDKGRTIKRGRWFGKDVVKGNWSAVWTGSR